MVARVTMAEIDTVRMSVDDAVELFRESVVPGAARAGRATRACTSSSRPRERRSF